MESIERCAKAKGVTVGRGKCLGIKSLSEWLEMIEAIGELRRIAEQVDPELGMSTITYPAVWQEACGSDAPA